jgi:hypothetical protein
MLGPTSAILLIGEVFVGAFLFTAGLQDLRTRLVDVLLLAPIFGDLLLNGAVLMTYFPYGEAYSWAWLYAAVKICIIPFLFYAISQRPAILATISTKISSHFEAEKKQQEESGTAIPLKVATLFGFGDAIAFCAFATFTNFIALIVALVSFVIVSFAAVEITIAMHKDRPGHGFQEGFPVVYFISLSYWVGLFLSVVLSL